MTKFDEYREEEYDFNAEYDYDDYDDYDSNFKKPFPKKPYPKKPLPLDDLIAQEAEQVSKIFQIIDEDIEIYDSYNVTINKLSAQAAINLQASIELALITIISVVIGDTAKAKEVTQELLQATKIKQVSYLRTRVANSRNVEITTADLSLVISIELLILVFVVVLLQLEIL
ncbi:spore coat protein [Proteinivorax hydrogeniformans]|uniref:Spore coat protein n=1 Tax=Proteinivorax hydrogeniformans TaxID=1826727 RepID=A0AAU8HSH4_9FIRM